MTALFITIFVFFTSNWNPDLTSWKHLSDPDLSYPVDWVIYF